MGAGVSAYSAYDASQKKKKAQKALENLPTPEASNVANDLTVSTRGADLRTQESGRTTASAIDALRGGGARAIIGGVGAVSDRANAVNADIGANLDEQQKNIDVMRANDNVRIQGIGEKRYENDVAGLSSQIASEEAAKRAGIASTMTNLTTAGQEYKNWRDEKGLTSEQKYRIRMEAKNKK